MMILDVDTKQKKKKGAQYFEKDEDLTDEWVLRHQAFLVEELRTKITKKFEKDNEKLVAEKKKPLPDKELKERLKAVKELENKFKKENKSKKVEAEGKGPSVEKFENQIVKIDERIKNLEAQSADREGNKEVALGTSKIVGFLLVVSVKAIAKLLFCAELHRPSTQRCLLEQDGCAYRTAVPQNPSREIQLGNRVYRRGFRVGVLTLPVHHFYRRRQHLLFNMLKCQLSTESTISRLATSSITLAIYLNQPRTPRPAACPVRQKHNWKDPQKQFAYYFNRGDGLPFNK